MAVMADSTPGLNEPVSPDELDAFQAEVGLEGFDNVIFVDGDVETEDGVEVWDSFIDANQDFTWGNGIPMVFRKNMTIGVIAGTYDWDTYPLETIQTYLAQ